MLTPAQVAPFLQNEDPLLRKLAQQYFAQSHDPSPATADDAWRMIDRVGNGELYASNFGLLPKLPQTEASLDRTLSALQSEEDETRKKYLEEVIVELPYGLLNRFRDKIDQAQGLSDDLRQHLAKRFELASIPPQELWDRLMSMAEEVQKNRSETKDYDPRPPMQLIEALARSPESAQWAVNILSDETIMDFREIFAVDLLGLMRHRPAAELIVAELLADEDADFLLESCTDALIRIGGTQVVSEIQRRWNEMPWGTKLYGCDVLSGVKLREGEVALVEFLGREPDEALRTKIAMALCDTAADDPRALEGLREMVNTGRWDFTLVDLDEEVVALFTMIDHHIPELPQWRAKLLDAEGLKKRRLAAHDKINPYASKVVKLMEQMSSQREGNLPGSDSDEIFSPAPLPPPIQPIRRDAPKVGRNDPCPCGSGKKFKKCCGK
jgi:hypothetical protein